MLVAFALLQIAATSPDSLARERVAGSLGVSLDSALTRFARDGFHGSVLVVKDRRIVLLKGYGLADPKRGVRNWPATRFEMNSMTKLFTGVSILQLAGAGRLRIDDPLERHLGPFPAAKRDITVGQLASHTSGIVVAGTAIAGDTRDRFVRDIRDAPREAAPGTEYRYTNAGYSLLGAIVEVVSGVRYETYLRRHVFAPAGMHTAIFRDEVPADDTLFARPHVGTGNAYVWGTRAAGGVWSTVGDFYRWLVAIEDGAVIPPQHRTLLFSPPQPPSQEVFGWHVAPATAGSRARIDKGGGSDSFASQMLYYPDDRVVIVWACNDLTRRWRQTLNRDIPEIVFRESRQ